MSQDSKNDPLYQPLDLDQDDERTVMAEIPQELLAQSVRGHGAAKPSTPEPAHEPDALLDVLLDDAESDRPTPLPARALDQLNQTVMIDASSPPLEHESGDGETLMLDAEERAGASDIADDALSLDDEATVMFVPPSIAPPSNPGREVAETPAAAAVEELDEAVEVAEQESTPAPVRIPPPRAEMATIQAIATPDGRVLGAAVTEEADDEQPTPEPLHDERDAVAYLSDTQQREGFVMRAGWLREEAEALTDPAARAHALLAVAEIYAMAGEDALARAVAEEARQLVPGSALAQRLVRGLDARDSQWTAVLDSLDVEARTLPSAEARCHSAMFGAEIARLALSDADGSTRRLDLAARANPTDPRAYLAHMTEALKNEDADKLRLPEVPQLASLTDAWSQVLRHRGLQRGVTGAPRTAYEGLLRARAALEDQDVPGTLTALEALSEVPGQEWLAASLAAPHAATRARAVASLERATAGSHASQAQRTLAARAIELSDPAAARRALEKTSGDAFSAADRALLLALIGADSAEAAPWIAAAANDPELLPLAAAVSAAISSPNVAERGLVAAGSDESVALVGLARQLTAASLATSTTAILAAREALAQANDAARDIDRGATRAIGFELDLEGGDIPTIARAIESWRDGEFFSGSLLAAATLFDAIDEHAQSLPILDRVLGASPANEGAARARLANIDGAEAANILERVANATDDVTRAALLLTEAGLRDPAEAEPRLRRAIELAPALPLAAHIGEQAARRAGDRESLIEWLRLRRESSVDPIERAHDLVRESLLSGPDTEEAETCALLEEALSARPDDVGLRELTARHLSEPLADEGAWRASQAASATGPDAARLALQAAIDLELSGDLAGALVAAKRALAAGDTQLAPLAIHRLALSGHGTGELIDELMTRAREVADPTDKAELYNRLAELDERGRGDVASGLLFRRTLIEELPGHLSTLRQIASVLITEGRDEELEPIALEIAKAQTGPEAVAHATLSARLRLRSSTWDDTLEPVRIAYNIEPPTLWAQRQMSAHARTTGQHELAASIDQRLAELTERPSEIATLLLRASGALRQGGDIEGARSLIERALESLPDHLVLLLERADLLESLGEPSNAAETLEQAANIAVTEDERKLDFYRAAVLWLDQVKDTDRGVRALEAVAEIDASYADVFDRLQAIYTGRGASVELAELLKRRLDAITDPTERVEMEVVRGRALAELGETEAAKQALLAALETSPDHIDALTAFADLCASEGDWTNAEQAWIRIARHVSDPERQSAIYLRLGEVYDEFLPDPERAELAYSEILKRSPGDATARGRLARVYQRSGDFPRAIEQQTMLVEAAVEPEDKCRRTVELAEIHEASGDPKKAEVTLVQARKAWPKDEIALAGLARFYQRTGQGPTAQILLDRAVADARRALGTGRFEPYLFSTIATVAELRGNPGAASVARASVAALDGDPIALPGAGAAAGDTSFDDLLAPDVLTPAFRDLLQRTGPLLDLAVPYDLSTIRATPLLPTQAALSEWCSNIARQYGLTGLQLLVSPVLGPTCIPAGSHPPTLVIGQPLLAAGDEALLTFLVHRALKVIQSNTAGLARTAPIDLWPLVAAYLKAFSPSFVPQGVDAGRLASFQAAIQQAGAPRPDPNLSVLAAEVIGSIGNRASTLNTAVNGWGSRAGLLAVGDPSVALTGVAWAGGHLNAPPPLGKERTTWIGRNAEARELMVFSVSDAYAEIRDKLAL